MEIVSSPKADDDLGTILEYGFREWDEDEALAYVAQLSLQRFNIRQHSHCSVTS